MTKNRAKIRNFIGRFSVHVPILSLLGDSRSITVQELGVLRGVYGMYRGWQSLLNVILIVSFVVILFGA